MSRAAAESPFCRTIKVRVPATLKRAVRQLAARNGETVADTAFDLVRLALRNQGLIPEVKEPRVLPFPRGGK